MKSSYTDRGGELSSLITMDTLVLYNSTVAARDCETPAGISSESSADRGDPPHKEDDG